MRFLRCNSLCIIASSPFDVGTVIATFQNFAAENAPLPAAPLTNIFDCQDGIGSDKFVVAIDRKVLESGPLSGSDYGPALCGPDIQKFQRGAVLHAKAGHGLFAVWNAFLWRFGIAILDDVAVRPPNLDSSIPTVRIVSIS